MKPKLFFKIDPRRDVKTFFCFLEESKFDNGRNLKWAVFNKFPNFKKSVGEKYSKKKVEKFVNEIYKRDQATIKRAMARYEKSWGKKEDNFYQLTQKLFSEKFWPKGRYYVMPTIWGMYPRFLDERIFQLPYRGKKLSFVNMVIAHEMLHFIFYKYFWNKFPRYQKDRYSFFSWHVSEIFNVIVQNSPEWKKVFGEKSLPYPEHRKIVTKLQKKYYKKEITEWIIDNLIEDIISEVKKINH
jgi:hypothetical protein